MVEEKRRKPRPPTQKPYARKNKDAQKPKDAPKTSAQPAKSNSRTNLTLHDWLTVVAFVDAHPAMSQAAIVQHFATLASKAIVELCAQMEAVCLQRVAEDDDSLQLMSLLRRLRGRVQREEMLNAKHWTTLDS